MTTVASSTNGGAFIWPLPRQGVVRSERPVNLSVSFSRRGFSLLELLVVLTIISILAALALPAIRQKGSSSLSSASIQLAGMIDLARQTGTQNQTRARLCILCNVPSSPSYNYRTYAVQYLDLSTGQWVNATKWSALPAGIVFDDISTPVNGNSVMGSPVFTPITFQGAQLNSGVGVTFNSDGILVGGPTLQTIRLSEGATDPAGIVHLLTQNDINWAELVVNKYSGQVVVVRP